MKVLDKKLYVENQIVRRAEEENEILKICIGNPYLIQLKESFQNEKKWFLILEYCPCGDLRRIMNKQRDNMFTEQAVRPYICEVAFALNYLHQNNILYRDLKPDNILIQSDGHIKLTDFGLSKRLSIDVELTQSFVGSTAYLAPEVIQSQPHGKSIDWYQLGTLIYELLIRVPPHLAETEEQLRQQILTAPLILEDRFSDECADLIRKLLCRNPERRLGARYGFQEIQDHAWFAGIDWGDVEEKWLYVKTYQPKRLKDRSYEIDFGSIIAAKQEREADLETS